MTEFIEKLTAKIVDRIRHEQPYAGDDIAPIIREELELALHPIITVEVLKKLTDEQVKALREMWNKMKHNSECVVLEEGMKYKAVGAVE